MMNELIEKLMNPLEMRRIRKMLMNHGPRITEKRLRAGGYSQRQAKRAIHEAKNG